MDYFGPLPVTPRGNTYILLYTDRFSRRADMSPSLPLNLQLKARPSSLSTGTSPFGSVHVASYRTTASSSAPSFPTSYMSFLVFEKSPPAPAIQAVTVVWSALTTQWPKMSMIVNECPNNWDAQLSHVDVAYNNSVSTGTSLAPNEVHMGRLRRLPLIVFDRSGVAGHQGLARDHLAYCDLASERQQLANDIIREMHALTVSRSERRNSAVSDALRQVPNFVVGNWVWLYSTASTIRQRAKAGTDAKARKIKFALNWTGPYKILAVGPGPSSNT